MTILAAPLSAGVNAYPNGVRIGGQVPKNRWKGSVMNAAAQA